MSDRLAHLTESQRRAIHTIDRSVLVSAAAGSGKTTVLAERCAALVCDLPANLRCRIDELLVVTFTEAAAAEMKTRIGAAIRERLKASPHDGYLQQQIYLIDTASISTIHAFCRSLIQRWFPQAGVDPQAAVLSGEEAQLLKDEVLDAFFVELYAGLTPLGLAFQTLVDDYSAGDDRLVARVVLQLHEFISSLPNPDRWLADALEQLDPANDQSLLNKLNSTQHLRISEELRLQIEFSRQSSRVIRQCWPIAAMHAEAIDEHAYQLQTWLDKLNGSSVKHWEGVAAEICEFAFDRAKSRPRDLTDDDKAAFECAKSLRDETKKLFANRLQEACCSFTTLEYTEGLQRIAPYAQTLGHLATEFDFYYRQAKNDRAAIDFNDLQRYAHRLLHDEGTDQPSAIARQLQQQYRYVLVDEFQDVDPLQEAIIRCVSRESADTLQGNLFTVGDIKQSIYRFRLAEPTLFANRAGNFQTEPGRGSLIHLQENFRSRPVILDAINIIFRSLMSADFGGSNYDSSAELHAGLQLTSGEHTFDRPAVALHLIEPVVESTRDNENEDEESDASDELEGIEREAYLIGDLIQGWMSDKSRKHVAAKPETPSQSPSVRPLEYSDIVILLRSLPHKAGPMADILRRMGLPVRLDRDRMGMDSTEVRDVVSLLKVLDNAQQDIPIAAVLRSPLLGRAFNEDELLEIRFMNREIPFYQAVQEYAEHGPLQSLRDELAVIIAIIDRYRGRIQRTPVAEVLWEIYEEYDYLAYVAGLPDGARRREHLISLHELARQFAGFTRQGLQRFLRFVEEMAERDQSAPSAAASTNENVIRIMTIHTSKGLEFPVVILADLQKSFNLTDIRTPVLLDRKLGIAMRAADPEKRILYPTLISQLAAESGCRESLSEELRVLYVALTRAREHLVLVGRTKFANVYAQRALQSSQGGGGNGLASLPRLQLETACNYLDWLLPALGTAPRETVQWPGQEKPSALFRVNTYERHITDPWRIPPAIVSTQIEALSAVANLQPLAPNEPLAIPAAIETHLQALGWMYPATELTTVPARISVTELKRRWQTDLESDERLTPMRGKLQVAQPAFMLEQSRLTPARRGTATHRFLQLIDLARSCNATDLAVQMRELVESGRIAPADVEGIALTACTWFLASELGRRIRSHSDTVLREVPFVSRLQPSDYDPMIQGRDHRDVLLLRGMIDVLLRQDSKGIELIDYKTDHISAEACALHAENYRAQIDHYTAAIEGIYGQPVAHRWLVFLHAQCTIDLAPH